MKGNSPVLSECDVNEKSWQLMRNNVAEVDANQSSPHHHQFQSNHMITRLRFAYVSLAFMVFFSRMQNRLKTWSTIENRDSTLYTIIYFNARNIISTFFFFFSFKTRLTICAPVIKSVKCCFRDGEARATSGSARKRARRAAR